MSTPNYVEKLVKSFLPILKIDTNKVFFEEIGNLMVIWIEDLFYPNNIKEGIEALQFINNLLKQFNSPIYYMQISSRVEVDEQGHKHSIFDQVALQIEMDDFKKVNQQVGNALKNEN